MSDVTDEVLNAYVDGALDAETMREVEAHLARDGEARAYVAALRRINALAPDAMDALLGDVPQSLIDTIKAAPDNAPLIEPMATATATASDNVVPLRPRGPQRPPTSRLQYSLLAAALALTIVTATGYVLLTPHTGDGPAQDVIATGPLPAQSTLSELLEQGEQGIAAAVATASGKTQQATVMSTFKDARGRYCRELEVGPDTDPGIVSSASMACRESTGVWVVEGSAVVAAAPAGGSNYVPSGSANDEPLAPLMRSLNLGKAMSREDERAALDSRWKP